MGLMYLKVHKKNLNMFKQKCPNTCIQFYSSNNKHYVCCFRNKTVMYRIHTLIICTFYIHDEHSYDPIVQSTCTVYVLFTEKGTIIYFKCVYGGGGVIIFYVVAVFIE